MGEEAYLILTFGPRPPIVTKAQAHILKKAVRMRVWSDAGDSRILVGRYFPEREVDTILKQTMILEMEVLTSVYFNVLWRSSRRGRSGEGKLEKSA